MQVRGLRSHRRVGANMTPMIDVVFLLIIFFLVSSHLAKQETRLPLELPFAGSHVSDEPGAGMLTIHATADGTIWIHSDEVESTQIDPYLRLHRAEHGDASSVRLRMDRRTRYDAVEPILRAAANAGISQVTFAVHQASGG